MQVSPITELARTREAEPLGRAGSADAFAPAAGAAEPAEPSGISFGDVLGKLVETANRADAVASQKMEALASGAGDDLHGTMIATKEADISVKLVASIRTKLLDAFNEIWKTSV
jgi:flagellar hook-basal body complex protein FliE